MAFFMYSHAKLWPGKGVRELLNIRFVSVDFLPRFLTENSFEVRMEVAWNGRLRHLTLV